MLSRPHQGVRRATRIDRAKVGRGSRPWRKIAKGLLALILALSIQLPGMGVANSAEIWFAPMDSFVRPEAGYGGSADYMALFQTQSDELVRFRVAVFKVYAQFVQWAKDDELRRVFTELKRLHIALAMEAGMLTASERCGHGVEGYGGDGAAKLATRIEQLGGDLAYIAMDEPMFYGHHFSGGNACHASLADIARDAATNLTAVKAVFRQLRAGDIEPVGPSPDDALVQDYARWADTFRATTGEPFAFVHADVQWKEDWRHPLKKLAVVLGERKIPLGVIYNGGGDSDEAWVAQAEAHYRVVEDYSEIAPDQVVFQSWEARPSHLLPDTDPGALTHLLSRHNQAAH